MAKGMDIRINGVRIKQPTECKVQRYNLTKSGRVASGKMTMELVAKKRKLDLIYDVLSGSDLELILSLIDTEQMFFQVQWLENGDEKSMTAYVGEIVADKFRTDGMWYWKNVEFHLIEQ